MIRPVPMSGTMYADKIREETMRKAISSILEELNQK